VINVRYADYIYPSFMFEDSEWNSGPSTVLKFRWLKTIFFSCTPWRRQAHVVGTKLILPLTHITLR
jgi:hypothetical protein